ncbi:MAG: NAD(P)-dependent glycerol-3-phosphate dehydrogenase [Reyranella sp.]|uniref:NAD(P)H-dependent glycerol-3-phosphate dehydrogenase n=1 Tax=Reyranella sp. TaxID=1929291 RepID=UPI001AD21FD4|nr:NAD(P)H-dependent glycerol-3-phosphate dehydrogenase [Reyranella sp.]MBN9091349.1 NAD(P)-dependent glycerol-3-phosphate dehydrogenase [Reyranella sp.]
MVDAAHIGVVGGGAWGTALACLARRAGRRVTLWSRDPAIAKAIATDKANPVYLPGIPIDAGIEAAAGLDDLGACDGLLLVCPAQAVRELARRLPGDGPVVICAKGIEVATGLLMPEVLAEVQPGRRIAVLSGPSFAEEAIRGLPTAISIATFEPALGQSLATALAAGAFRPYWSHDVLGVALGGAVKNVLAIAAGIVEGRGLGYNAAAALATRGFAEMARLGQAMGAELETLTGLSGLGDLVLTCHGPLSRNRSLGLALGKGTRLADHMQGRRQVVEGEATAPAVLARAARLGIEMPICGAVDAILHKGADLDQTIRSLLARPLRREGE